MEESLARQRASIEKQMETIRRGYPLMKWSAAPLSAPAAG